MVLSVHAELNPHMRAKLSMDAWHLGTPVYHQAPHQSKSQKV